MPEITVIITAYKDRGWIDEAIDSARFQTFEDYDIILCSDGNEEIRRYADKYNIPFLLYPKSNYATLVNNAVKEAKGKWIKVLHDDDILTENCLSDLYGCRANADLVYANAFIFRDNDMTNPYLYEPPANITLRSLFPIISNPVNFEAEIFRRDVFLGIGGFDANLGYAEDYDLLLNLLSHGYKLAYCDSAVVWYRQHDRQITGNEPEMRQREQDYLISKYMGFIVERIRWDS